MKIKVLIPINDCYSKIIPVLVNEVQIKSIREIEYECWKVKATEKFLNIYAKTPPNHSSFELLACFNWDQIIGYEVIQFDFLENESKE